MALIYDGNEHHLLQHKLPSNKRKEKTTMKFRQSSNFEICYNK